MLPTQFSEPWAAGPDDQVPDEPDQCHFWFDLELLLMDDEESESFVMERGSPTLFCVLEEGHDGPHVLAQGGLARA